MNKFKPGDRVVLSTPDPSWDLGKTNPVWGSKKYGNIVGIIDIVYNNASLNYQVVWDNGCANKYADHHLAFAPITTDSKIKNYIITYKGYVLLLLLIVVCDYFFFGGGYSDRIMDLFKRIANRIISTIETTIDKLFNKLLNKTGGN